MKKMAKAVASKKRTSASSSSKRARTLSHPPSPANIGAGIAFDFRPLSPERELRSLSPERKRKTTEEREEEN